MTCRHSAVLGAQPPQKVGLQQEQLRLPLQAVYTYIYIYMYCDSLERLFSQLAPCAKMPVLTPGRYSDAVALSNQDALHLGQEYSGAVRRHDQWLRAKPQPEPTSRAWHRRRQMKPRKTSHFTLPRNFCWLHCPEPVRESIAGGCADRLVA